MSDKDLPDTTPLSISENTPVKVGLIITLLSIFGGGIWWASSITSKLDSISTNLITFQSSTSTSMSELKATDIAFTKEISDIKLKLAIEEESLRLLKEKLSYSK